MKYTDLSNVNYIPLEEVPTHDMEMKWKWKAFFDKLQDGAAVLNYNNRQRAHQVRHILIVSAKYHKLTVKTRIIHGTTEIHGTDDWLLYAWKA